MTERDDLSARSLRVALSGCVPDDDPHIIADMMGEIERLTRERDEIDAELSHYIGLACANSRVFWCDRAADAEAQVKTLRAALTRIQHELSIPAAEYVPAIGDVFGIIRVALSSLPAPERNREGT